MEKNEQNLQQINDDDVDIAEVFRKIWTGRWIILITTVIFFTCSVIYLAYNSSSGTKEYESQATILVESPSPDSLITVITSPLFLNEVLKINLTGLKPGKTLSVAQVLDQRTKPPQGNLSALINRISVTKGNSGILVITVRMQDPHIVTQLTDSLVQKLTQFLREIQIKRVAKNQKMLALDTIKNLQVLKKTSLMNLQYLSKSTSNSIQFLTEGTVKDIQFLKEGSTKNIQFLTEGYLKAESIYQQSQQALADYYNRNSKNLESIDSLEVKRLNSDIKLKYNVYSAIYQQLETTKLDAKKQNEQAKLDMAKQLNQAKIDAAKQLNQAKLDAEKQLEQTRIDAANQIERVIADAENKIPLINVVEPATVPVQLNVLKTKKVVLIMILFGLIAGIGIVFGKNFYDKNFTSNAKK